MSETIIPMVIVPLTFLFVLLIILISKAPKVGAWVVGGLLLLGPLVLVRFARGGAFSHEEAIPLFVVPVTFLFVLLVILLAKAPKAGITMIVAVVVMAVAGGLAVMTFNHSRTDVYGPGPVSYPSSQIRQQTERRAAVAVIDGDVGVVYDGTHTPLIVPSTPILPTISSAPLSPIWSEGVEQEFEADVYPSSLAAAKALGRRMVWPVRTVVGDPNTPIKVILFQEGNDRSLIATFGREMEKELPDVQCAIEADLRNIHPGEVGLTLRLDTAHQVVALVEGTDVVISNPQDSTRIVASAFTESSRASAEAEYLDKPWVESFGVFAGVRPDQQYIVARSNGSCMSEGEAHQQALEDARARIAEFLGKSRRWEPKVLPQPAISTTDVLNGGFVTDRFVQGFNGSAGKVWRQAILVDVSGAKLAALAQRKAGEIREVRETWARMGLSVVGVLVLIGVIYFFLNMATRGYYEWSLRIAGVILAVVAVVSILMIVR
jgi:hypothetical protein